VLPEERRRKKMALATLCVGGRRMGEIASCLTYSFSAACGGEDGGGGGCTGSGMGGAHHGGRHRHAHGGMSF